MMHFRRMLGWGLAIFVVSTLHVSASELKSKSQAAQKAMDNNASNSENILATTLEKIYVKNIIKDYLCIASNLAAAKADKDAVDSFEQFDILHKKLTTSVRDPKMSTIVAFVAMSKDKFEKIFKQPYSQENAQNMISLAKSIEEGEDRISLFFEWNSSFARPGEVEARLEIATLAQLYAVHHAGLKDDNLISKINQAVVKFEAMLIKMQSQPRRTIPMNQLLDQIEMQWKVVKQFYLDIDENDLPLIVCRMTDKINNTLIRYSELAANVSASKH